MKSILSVLILLCIISTTYAQVKITNQPGDKYFDEVKAACVDKLPTQQAVLAQKPTAVVTSIMDTLKKYDWYMLGGYNYTDKQYDNYFAKELFANEKESQYQFKFFRIESDGTQADFSLGKFKTQSAAVTTTSFAKNTCPVYRSIKVAKGFSFIQSVIYEESEYLKIVSYKNGVLIIDITKSGKITDPVVRFRNVYYAVPKKFEWSF